MIEVASPILHRLQRPQEICEVRTNHENPHIFFAFQSMQSRTPIIYPGIKILIQWPNKVLCKCTERSPKIVVKPSEKTFTLACFGGIRGVAPPLKDRFNG